jgi:hypothetical protein
MMKTEEEIREAIAACEMALGMTMDTAPQRFFAISHNEIALYWMLGEPIVTNGEIYTGTNPLDGLIDDYRGWKARQG